MTLCYEDTQSKRSTSHSKESHQLHHFGYTIEKYNFSPRCCITHTIAASDMHLYSVIHRKKLTEYRSSLEFLLLNFSATFLLLDSENLMTCVFHLASASLALQYCCMYSLSDTISSVTDLHDKNIHRMA